MTRLKEEVKNKLMELARNYDADEVEAFIINRGWEDWMEDFLNENVETVIDGEPVSDKACDEINNVLKQIFIEAHKDDEDEENDTYTEEDLEEALCEYLEDCERTGHHDLEECAEYFVQENRHMNLEYDEVLKVLKKINNNI